MASSPLVGRRPRMSRMLWYSSGFSPRAAYGCSFSGVAAAFSTVSSTGTVGVEGVVVTGGELQKKGDASTGPGAWRGRSQRDSLTCPVYRWRARLDPSFPFAEGRLLAAA